MIDFYQHGTQIGISLHGWGGFLLITYFVLEMCFLFLTKSLIVNKLIIWINVRRQVKKLIPRWWQISKISLITIERKSTGFEVYVQVKNKITNNWTNDYVIVNWFGKIKNQKLTKLIKSHDVGEELKIKEWMRNKVLEDIGI